MQLVTYATAVMFVSLIASMVINLYSIFTIGKNQKRKEKIIENLAKLYQEEGMTQYSVDDISQDYKARGNLFIMIIATLAAIGFIIPLIVFISKILEDL